MLAIDGMRLYLKLQITPSELPFPAQSSQVSMANVSRSMQAPTRRQRTSHSSMHKVSDVISSQVCNM